MVHFRSVDQQTICQYPFSSSKVRTNVEFGTVEEFNSDYRKHWEKQQALLQEQDHQEDLEDAFDEAEFNLRVNHDLIINQIKIWSMSRIVYLFC